MGGTDAAKKYVIREESFGYTFFDKPKLLAVFSSSNFDLNSIFTTNQFLVNTHTLL